MCNGQYASTPFGMGTQQPPSLTSPSLQPSSPTGGMDPAWNAQPSQFPQQQPATGLAPAASASPQGGLSPAVSNSGPQPVDTSPIYTPQWAPPVDIAAMLAAQQAAQQPGGPGRDQPHVSPMAPDPAREAYALRGIPYPDRALPAPSPPAPGDPLQDAYARRSIPRAQGGSVTSATAGMGFAKGGLIASDVPGRTDRIPMNVRPNSFVIPADIVSGVGQGNTEAGARIFDHLFAVPERAKGGAVLQPAIVTGDRGNFNGAKMFDEAIASGPYGSKMPGKPRGKPSGMPMINTRMPRPHAPVIGPRPPKTRLAEGGEASGHVPIVAAGGEYVCEPETVEHIGGGDYDKGHEILDKMVVSLRKQIISHMRKLPPPVKD